VSWLFSISILCSSFARSPPARLRNLTVMNEGQTVFAQLMDQLSKYEFDKCIAAVGTSNSSSNGSNNICESKPSTTHQRTPCVFKCGSPSVFTCSWLFSKNVISCQWVTTQFYRFWVCRFSRKPPFYWLFRNTPNRPWTSTSIMSPIYRDFKPDTSEITLMEMKIFGIRRSVIWCVLTGLNKRAFSGFQRKGNLGSTTAAINCTNTCYKFSNPLLLFTQFPRKIWWNILKW